MGRLAAVAMTAQLVVLCGCASYGAIYTIGLTEVERPAAASERYGEPHVDLFTEEGVRKVLFEDQMVKIVWLVAPVGQIGLLLENKTLQSLKILWDEAAYVDTSGQSHRVIHTGITYAHRDAPQPPTVVVRGATIRDAIFPVDHIYYDRRGWQHQPLLPLFLANTAGVARAFQAEAGGLRGQVMQVLLPLDIEGVVNEYVFRFRIDAVQVGKLGG